MANAMLSKRFSELRTQAEAVEATKIYENSNHFPGDRIDNNLFLGWKVKARSLVALACTQSSQHFKEFIKVEEPVGYRTAYTEFTQLLAVLEAAQEDFDGGYLNSLRSIVQAEVFSSELDQAVELLDAGYVPAAAVIAGVVLETTIRQMCGDRDLPVNKLDRMNADLAKAGAYTSLVQKRITAIAAIRNSAAHGNADQFSKEDVSEMITYVERFVSDHLPA